MYALLLFASYLLIADAAVLVNRVSPIAKTAETKVIPSSRFSGTGLDSAEIVTVSFERRNVGLRLPEGLAFEQKDGGTPVGDVSITISVEPNQLSDGETLNIVTKATFQDSQDSPLKIVAPAGTMAASVIQYQVATSRDARSDFVIQTLEANNMWQPAATLGVSIQQNSLWVYVTADDAGKSIRIIEKEHM